MARVTKRSFFQRFLDYFAFTHGTDAATNGPWYVTKNDLVGGWCIRTTDKLPSSGRGVTIADFIREQDAQLCAAARNMYRQHDTALLLRDAHTSDLAIADDGRLYLKTMETYEK